MIFDRKIFFASSHIISYYFVLILRYYAFINIGQLYYREWLRKIGSAEPFK